MKKVKINIPGKTHWAYVGNNVLTRLPSVLSHFNSAKIFIISDDRLNKFRQKVKAILKSRGFNFVEIPVKAGEGFKKSESIYKVFDQLIKKGAKRDSLIIALGGGSIGDGAGFIAATYLRGIPWIGIPTTLLSQVDSSVGGKTGINLGNGKNLIGAFHQPSAIFCDTQTLNTLSRREIVSGLGEAIKYGILYDKKFFKYIGENWQRALEKDPKVLSKIVAISVKWKAKVIAGDERDLKGSREILNFGHTFGHALETVTQYKKFQHGEAIIWGIGFAVELSLVKQLLDKKEYLEIKMLLGKMSVPKLDTVDFTSISRAMQYDKKIRKGRINFVLLKKIGAPVSVNSITLKDMKLAWVRLKGSSH